MAHVIVVGAGTIGSHLLPHLARSGRVSAITVIDRDRYEASNLATQNVVTSDLGKSKAMMQVAHVKEINRAIATNAYFQPVEDVPLGRLRADAILACVDSRRARMTINQAAWRLGVPWINAGLDASEMLVRVQVFVPSPDAPCLECAWDDRDYELVEQAYPCQADPSAAETGAPSSLGALAASLQAIECDKLLSGDHAHLLAARDVVIDLRHHRHYVTTFARNARCRMPDHAGWDISPCTIDPGAITLDDVMHEARELSGAEAGVTLGVAGQRFAQTLTCPGCGDHHPAGYVYRGSPRPSARCGRCQRALTATGFDLHDAVALGDFPRAACRRSLAELGIVTGDVLTLATPAVTVHMEMRGPACEIAS